MKRTNKIILAVLILLVVFSLFLGFKKYVLDKDYFIYLNASCTGEYSCFEQEEVEDPYIKVYRKAYEIQSCIDTQDCDPFVCREDEDTCTIIPCSEEELEDGETCVNQVPE